MGRSVAKRCPVTVNQAIVQSSAVSLALVSLAFRYEPYMALRRRAGVGACAEILNNSFNNSAGASANAGTQLRM